MRFTDGLTPATLQRRYKRFLADVVLADGSTMTCHCPNTGSMMGCADPGMRVWLSHSANPRRQYGYTWELVETASGTLVGVHTGRTNALVREALERGLVPGLSGYTSVQAEVNVPNAPMRADFRLSGHAEKPDCFVEVKNVTAAVDPNGVAVFPDAVSERGRRHLEVLTSLVRDRGLEAATVFCAQRDDVTVIEPADWIDPAYGEAMRSASEAGVRLLGLGARVTPDEVTVDRVVPVELPNPTLSERG